jgi:integrase
MPRLPGSGAGKDPAVERREMAAARDVARQAESDAPSFADLTAAYFERHARPHKAPQSIKDDTWLLAKYVPESWAARKINDITAKEVSLLHERIGSEHGPYAANHLARLLRAMFNLAKRRDWKMLPADADNPAAGMNLFDEPERKRYLKPDEFQRLNERLMAAPPVWRAFFPLSCFLDLRRGELLALKWSQVDLRTGLIDIAKTKNSNPLVLPIPTPTAAIPSKLAAAREPGCEWVFPSERGSASEHIEAPSKAWQKIREAAGGAGCKDS